jgi:hypothetical protein
MRKLNKICSVTLFSFFLAASVPSMAQEKKEDKLSLSLSLNHDAFFGFNPGLTASYPVSSKTDLTFYGIQWGAGTARAWGNWTEFGLGANFKTGNFAINPQLGFTMGNLLSSGTNQRGVVGDGIVPNLTVNYDDKKIIGQLYAGYYAALRSETAAGQSTLNYVHYWLNVGGRVTPWLALGAHYENLNLTGGKINGGGTTKSADYYQWIGPFVQVSKGAGGLRFSFGTDLTKETPANSSNDFYKLSFFYNF